MNRDDHDHDDEPTAAVLALGLADLVMRQMQSNPVRTLAGAVGAGYVLGAGLPDVAVRVLASTALRYATAGWVERWLGDGASQPARPDAPSERAQPVEGAGSRDAGSVVVPEPR